MLTDRMWARSTWEQFQLFAEGNVTWAYEFRDRNAPSYLPFPPTFPPGAFHAAEVPYLFVDDEFTAAATPDQRALSDRMIRYWANFARHGNPNGADLPTWAAFADDNYVHGLGPGSDGTRRVDYVGDHHLDFWQNQP
ncbi:MAG: carboxylesterase family protein [Ilumatobacteraceae bacterium]